ncbi:VanZ family protein [Streptomyces marincola]|uniref:VanZ family protein n=1 Tax=Streptomyces marincola TaxID=2878388 RepID=UPI001CF573CB|nr:VanZ family protein [Streptomyces marincola]UCM90003.1 VanZ family protein [Streptomyces marincola]
MQQQQAGSPGPGAGPRLRTAALVLLAAHLLCVAWLSLRPLEVLWVAPANVEPFATISAGVDGGFREALRTIGGGMLPLAPLGVLLPLLGRNLGGARFTSLTRTTFAGGMISLALEYGQSLVPSRVADVDAVILNSFGIVVVHQLAYGCLRDLVLGRTRPSLRRPAARRLAARPPAATERHLRRTHRSSSVRPRVWTAPGGTERDRTALPTHG